MLTELSKSLLRRYIQKAGTELSKAAFPQLHKTIKNIQKDARAYEKIKNRNKGINKAVDKGNLFDEEVKVNEISSELLKRYIMPARKDATTRALKYYDANASKIEKNKADVDKQVNKADNRNKFIKKAGDKIAKDDDTTRRIGDYVEKGIKDIVNKKFKKHMEKAVQKTSKKPEKETKVGVDKKPVKPVVHSFSDLARNLNPDKVKKTKDTKEVDKVFDKANKKPKDTVKKPSFTMKNGKIVAKESINEVLSPDVKKLSKGIEMLKKSLDKMSKPVKKKEKTIDDHIKDAMQKRMETHAKGTVNAQFLRQHIEDKNKDNLKNNKKLEKELGNLVTKVKIKEEFPTNVMGNSSSTAGTGPIDTFDPMLGSNGPKSLKKLNRKVPNLGLSKTVKKDPHSDM